MMGNTTRPTRKPPFWWINGADARATRPIFVRERPAARARRRRDQRRELRALRARLAAQTSRPDGQVRRPGRDVFDGPWPVRMLCLATALAAVLQCAGCGAAVATSVATCPPAAPAAAEPADLPPPDAHR